MKIKQTDFVEMCLNGIKKSPNMVWICAQCPDTFIRRAIGREGNFDNDYSWIRGMMRYDAVSVPKELE